MDQADKPSKSPSQPSLPPLLHPNDANEGDENVEQPPLLHQNDADEDDENVKQLRECSSVYIALQDCLVNSDRNWKQCQKEVKALKTCNEGRKR